MKSSFKHSLHLAFILAGAFVMQSCAKETLLGPPANEGMAELSFTARMPSVATVATRATETGTAAENRIDDIHILVFETTGELVYKGKARELTPSGAHSEFINFKATLPVGETYDFVVLANAESLLSQISTGATPAIEKSDVEALVSSYTDANSENGRWKTNTPIPMWDETEELELTSSSSPSFHLTRMLARINVEYTPGMGVEDNFQLTSVRYYNYNTSGSVIPDADNMEGTEDERYATLPSLPANPGTQSGESVEYTAITNHETCKNQIYVFEAANKGKYDSGNDNWIGNPCLVVGGKYDSDGDDAYDDEPLTWYRIDFIKKSTSEEQWLSLLRNFSYNVVISSVRGDGYDDPDVALESVPMNMDAGVIDWNDAQMGDAVIDGPNFLYVGDSRNEGLRKAASLYRNATSTDEIGFRTNIALNLFEMELTEGGAIQEPSVAERAEGVVSKIVSEFYEVAIVESEVEGGVTYGKFVFTALTDYASTNPVSTLTVSSGRIRYAIEISQRDADPNDWNDGGNQNEEL